MSEQIVTHVNQLSIGRMKSTEVQTLGVLTRVRDIANDDIVYMYNTWSKVQRFKGFNALQAKQE